MLGDGIAQKKRSRFSSSRPWFDSCIWQLVKSKLNPKILLWEPVILICSVSAHSEKEPIKNYPRCFLNHDRNVSLVIFSHIVLFRVPESNNQSRQNQLQQLKLIAQHKKILSLTNCFALRMKLKNIDTECFWVVAWQDKLKFDIRCWSCKNILQFSPRWNMNILFACFKSYLDFYWCQCSNLSVT